MHDKENIELADATESNLNKETTHTLKERLRKKTVQKAIDSFGAWEEREESSIEIVNNLRSGRRRFDAGS